jgi:HEAT repeat protein
MAKARSSEAKLARLRALGSEPLTPEAIQELRHFLGDASNLVVAEAAELIGKTHKQELTAELVESYERLADDDWVKKDKLCRGKITIIEALNVLEFADESFFLRGIRYTQMEPAWGQPTDAGVPIRVASAFGLVRIRYRYVLPLLVDLLCDEEKAARVGAVQALTYTGTEAAGLVLRLKARTGDKDPEVVAECFTGLLELTPQDGVPFVTEFLNAGDEAIQEAALIALGSSRRPEAFEVLKAFASDCLGDIEETAFIALALLRLPAANEFLLSLITREQFRRSARAISALAVHRYDTRLTERVAEAVTKTSSAELRALFEKKFRARD